MSFDSPMNSAIERLLRLGRAHARKLLYARILLKADVDDPDRWTVESVSYETVSRTLKKRAQASPQAPMGDPTSKEHSVHSRGAWRRSSISTSSLTIHICRWSASTS